MFCVTTAAILGLMPYPLETANPDEQKANRAYLEKWLDRLVESRLSEVNNEPTSCPVIFPQWI